MVADPCPALLRGGGGPGVPQRQAPSRSSGGGGSSLSDLCSCGRCVNVHAFFFFFGKVKHFYWILADALCYGL